MRFSLLVLVLVLVLGPVRAAEPFFKKGDVIALVGGEDMVVASEFGYLELLLVRALPDSHLRFRNLAWEGDTVFEQRRDLNFPTWEEQLDKIGATVVIAQFGQMESLAGKEKLPEFIAAYEKLIERFSGGGKRRVAIIEPSPFEAETRSARELIQLRNTNLLLYAAVLPGIAERDNAQLAHLSSWMIARGNQDPNRDRVTHDGIHLNDYAQRELAWFTGTLLEERAKDFDRLLGTGVDRAKAGDYIEIRQALAAIRAKDRLWFDYWRPQNWAFLAGDRTAQPSSRDHLDPSKRWFPPEREEFLPLIEAKEKEIDALAQKLAQP